MSAIRIGVLAAVAVVACVSSARKGRVNPYSADDLMYVGRHYVPTGKIDPAFAKGDCTRAPDHPQVKLFCERKCDLLEDRDIKALCTGKCDSASSAEFKQFCHVLANETYYSRDACVEIKDPDLFHYCLTTNRPGERPNRPTGGGGYNTGGGGGDDTGNSSDCTPKGQRAPGPREGVCCSGQQSWVGNETYCD